MLLLSLMALVILSLLGAGLLTMSGTETFVTFRSVYREGSFYAAEGGIHVGLDQISANTATSTQAIPVTNIGNWYAYRSGRRNDPGPQPLQFVGTRPGTGYSIAVGTGYNPAGYIFYNYQMNVTGTGPRNALREVEALAAYGPVPE
ncbi:MAG: hypothetical protein U1B94_03460 [candidate division NC10 bacterium]|nr:hypothetical protein [candidate division NC10 bacterium]